MKRLLILLLVALLSISATFSEDGLPEDGEFSLDDIFAILEDPEAIAEIDVTPLQEILTDETVYEDEDGNTITGDDGQPLSVGEYLEQTVLEELEAQAGEEGISEEDLAILDTAETLVEGIKTAEATEDPETGELVLTLGDAAESQGLEVEDITEAVAETVAVIAVSQLSSDEEAFNTLLDGLIMLDGALKTMRTFGQAVSQTSMASSLYGHQNYKLFAASIGAIGSFATNMETVDSVMTLMDAEDTEQALMDELAEGGFSAGVGVQSLTVNFGMNFSWLVDNLYISAVVGSSNITLDPKTGIDVEMLGEPLYNLPPEGEDGLPITGSFSSSVFGVRANYRLVRAMGIPVLLRWNGLSLGTGLIYNGFNIDTTIDVGAFMAEGLEGIELEPGSFMASLSVDSMSYTVPVEISTGIQVLSILNINLGAGADLRFGDSGVRFALESEGDESISLQILNKTLDKVFQEADLSFPVDERYPMDVVNMKAMVGIGVGLGPATFNLDFTGFASSDITNVGLTIGANVVVRI